MSKGKKFDAAEKHFEKKRLEWSRRIKELEAENKDLREENQKLKFEWAEMGVRVTNLEEENSLLQELKDLSKDDIKLLLEKANHQKHMAELFSVMTKLPIHT